MTDLALAVDGLLSAAVQIGIGAVVLGLVLVLAYTVMRDSL